MRSSHVKLHGDVAGYPAHRKTSHSVAALPATAGKRPCSASGRTWVTSTACQNKTTCRGTRVRPNPSLSPRPTTAGRPASAVGVSSNVRPHTAGMTLRTTLAPQDARRAQIHASAHARSGQRSAHETYTSKPPWRSAASVQGIHSPCRRFAGSALSRPTARVIQFVVSPPGTKLCRSPRWSAAAKEPSAFSGKPR